ncbi:MAG: hypothetical protein WCK90_03295 [archaeon]
MDKLKVTFVFEILGRPAEHIVAGLNGLIEKLGKEKGVKVIESTVHPPIPAKDSEDLFTTFGEVTVELDNLTYFFGIMFAYMPAHVELIYPENINLANHDLGQLATTILHRLHDYDAVTKRIIFERDTFANKLKEISLPEFAKITGQQLPSATVSEVLPENNSKKKSKKSKVKSRSKKK